MIGGVVWIRRLSRKSDKRRGRTRWRQCRTVDVGRQKRIHTTAKGSSRTDEGGGQASQHVRAIKSERLGTEIRRPGGIEYVHAHIISVGPDAQFGIVEKVGAEMKAVAVVCAGSISGGGNGDALVGNWAAGRAGELADDPAISQVIVEHNGIATAAGLADTTKASPD